MPARAKLPPGKGKRVPLNMRTTRETREKLEKSAAGSGRSLVQEVEYRVEQSFLDEEARDREWGGNKLRGLFRMMVGAADIIEARTGKAFSEDFKTFLAVKKAWDRLLSSYAPDFKVSQKYMESVGMPRLESELPPPPIPPERPEASKKGLLDWAAYQKESERWRTTINKRRRRLEGVQRHLREIEELGKNVALDLLPPKPRD